VLAGCAWIDEGALQERQDPDGDGVLGAGAPGDPDCAPHDPALPRLWYRDADGDGYGDIGATTTDCAAPAGYTATADDCDDARPDVHPGAAERCDPDDVDEDCDGVVDDADADVAADSRGEWHPDADGDGYGTPDTTVVACDPPAGAGADSTDCDDTQPSVHPGATEECGDGIDQDCDRASSPCRLTGVTDIATTDVRLSTDDPAGATARIGAQLAWLPLDGPDALLLGTDGWADSTATAFLVRSPSPGDQPLSGASVVRLHATSEWSVTTTHGASAGGLLGDRPALLLTATATPAAGTDGGTGSGTGSGTDEGRLFLLDLGALLGAADVDVSSASPLFHARAGDLTGDDGVAVGDVDGDSAADLLVATTAHGAGDQGAVYLLLGAAGGPAPVDAADVDPFVYGDTTGDHLGGAVALADLTGDGVADLVVAAPDATGDAGQATGLVYLLEGPLHTADPYRSLARNADGVWSGAAAQDRAGGEGALAGGDDLDGDGLADLVIGGAGALGSDRPGSVWLVPGGAVLPTNGSLDRLGARIDGARPGDRAGAAVALPGDVDGDGHPDLLLGADLRDGARSASSTSDSDGAGAAWLLYGPAPTTGTYLVDTAAPWTLPGAPGDQLGAALGVGSGDGDDDGLTDLLVGAPGTSGDAGRVIVVLGRGE